MKIEQDSAQVRFPPPLVYLGFLLLGFGAETLRRPAHARARPPGRARAGCPALPRRPGGGPGRMGIFERVGTRVEPWRASTGIVESGPFRWTRNPMYLGMALNYAGLAIALDGPIALILLPVLLAIIQTQVIAREEHYLEGKFGQAFLDYKARVRRWFIDHSAASAWSAPDRPAPACRAASVSSRRRRGAKTGAALQVLVAGLGPLGDAAQRADELIERRLASRSRSARPASRRGRPAGNTWSSGDSPRRSAPWRDRACVRPSAKPLSLNRASCMHGPARAERRVEHVLEAAQDVIGVEHRHPRRPACRPSAPWLRI